MAYDAFLKIDGIDGDSVDKLHDKWIELLSFSWGVNNAHAAATGGGGGGATGRAQVHDFSFTKQTDSASPQLFTAVAGGKHFDKVVLSCSRAPNSDGTPGTEFLKITFQNVYLASLVEGGHNTDDAPLDQVSFSFQKVEFDSLTTSPTVAGA